MCKNAEGYVWTPEQRKRLVAAALLRESSIRRKIVVAGVVYANVTLASKATGISQRSLRRYANEGVPPQAGRNKLMSAKQLEWAHATHWLDPQPT